MKEIVIVSPEGQRFIITFEREAYRCWQILSPDYCQDALSGQHPLFTGYSSLEAAMSAIAEQIVKTEF